jgi:hypothetical protein
MSIELKSGSVIRIESAGNAGHTDSENTMTAHYTAEVTGMGDLQNGDRGASVNFETLTTDTRAGIMVKAKAAVDAAIAAG